MRTTGRVGSDGQCSDGRSRPPSLPAFDICRIQRLSEQFWG